jgi:uncharacterized repeat protein (TIGR01451 family)
MHAPRHFRLGCLLLLGVLRVAAMALGLFFLILLTASAASAQSADLVVTKTGMPDPVTAGSNLTYTVIVTNNGPDAAQNVTATDIIPIHTTFVSSTTSQGSALFNGTILTTNFGPVSVGTPATLSLVVHVNPGTPACTVIVNLVTATSTTADPNLANNTSMASTTVAPCATATPTATATATRTATPTSTATAIATNTVTSTPTATPTCILGDINCDGIVDIRDYGIWRQNFGQTNCGNPADLNGDCIVDIRDYGVWRANFGHTAGAPLRGEIAPAPQGTLGPAVLGSEALPRADGAGPPVPLVPLMGGLLGLGRLAGWRRRRPPHSE